MKILLDECVPRKLKDYFPGHDCHTVPDAGFSGKTNGELLTMAEELGFHVFLTLDKGIAYEQNLAGRGLAVILLRAKSSRLTDLVPSVPEILDLLGSLQSGRLFRVGK